MLAGRQPPSVSGVPDTTDLTSICSPGAGQLTSTLDGDRVAQRRGRIDRQASVPGQLLQIGAREALVAGAIRMDAGRTPPIFCLSTLRYDDAISLLIKAPLASS
jgi:hypothetical protein